MASERAKAALVLVAREGRARSRYTPFGFYTADGSHKIEKGDRSSLVRDAGEQRILRRILRLRAKGMEARRIAAELDRLGRERPREREPWTYCAIERIVASADRRSADLARDRGR